MSVQNPSEVAIVQSHLNPKNSIVIQGHMLPGRCPPMQQNVCQEKHLTDTKLSLLKIEVHTKFGLLSLQ